MNTNKGLRVAVRQSGDAVVVRPLGRLDPLTYQQMQQTLLYCVVTKPSSLVVELDELEVTNSSSLSLFTTVWIRVGEWPGVPMVLVAGRERLRAQLNRRKLSEFVPCFPTTSEALASVNGHSPHYRERVWLPPSLNAVRWAKLVVDRFFLHQQVQAQLGVVQLVVSELVRAATRTASSDISLRLEQYSEMLTVAVRNDALAAHRCSAATGPAIADMVSAFGRTLVDARSVVTWATFKSRTPPNSRPSRRLPACAWLPEANGVVAAQVS